MTRELLQQAYADGFNAGRIDRRLGWRSDYCWHGVTLEAKETYTYEYSRGYRAGWNEVQQ